jgi:hypothetical protein
LGDCVGAGIEGWVMCVVDVVVVVVVVVIAERSIRTSG